MNIETMPAPTFFEKLLTVSRSKPYQYFLKRIAIPIRYRFFGPRDPARFLAQLQADAVRIAARELETEGCFPLCSPLMLNEPEACPTCAKPTLMLVQENASENTCFDCWLKLNALDSN
jgi:hypothetical protein